MSPSPNELVQKFAAVFQTYGIKSPEGVAIRKSAFSKTAASSNKNGGSIGKAEIMSFIQSAIKTSYHDDEENANALFEIFRPCYLHALKNVQVLRDAIASRSNDRQGSRLKNPTHHNSLSFSEFRIFNVYLCMNAALFEIFISNDDTSSMTNIQRKDDKDIDLHIDQEKDPMITREQFLQRYHLISNKSTKLIVLEGIDSDLKAAGLFRRITSPQEDRNYIHFSEWLRFIRIEEINAKTDLGNLLSGNIKSKRTTLNARPSSRASSTRPNSRASSRTSIRSVSSRTTGTTTSVRHTSTGKNNSKLSRNFLSDWSSRIIRNKDIRPKVGNWNLTSKTKLVASTSQGDKVMSKISDRRKGGSPTMSNEQSTQKFPVDLALYALYKYDSSRDINAKELQELQTDTIWHTAIRAYSKEYHYEKSGVVVRPAKITSKRIKVVHLGTTNKPEQEIRDFVNGGHMSSRYQAHCYDILDNNCISFCTDLSMWICGKPLPSFCYDFMQATKSSSMIEKHARAYERAGHFAVHHSNTVGRNMKTDAEEKKEQGNHHHQRLPTVPTRKLGTRSSLPQITHQERGSPISIFISGYSLRAPKSNNAAEFYSNLVMKKDMVGPSLRYPPGYLGLPERAGHLPDIEHFDNHFFHMNPKQVDKTEVGIRLSLECVKEALMDAMIPMETIEGSATGVYVGCCETDFVTRSTFDTDKVGYEIVNGARSMMANRISFFFDLKGPSLVLDTACSSSIVALDLARQDILAGKVDRAIVVGANLTLDPHKNACFNAFQMLSPNGTCHTFDDRANGYCRSEGIFAIILESNTVCGRGGYAKLRASAVNSDGFKRQGITFPSSSSQYENARNAFEQSGISPSDIRYIEAHGTGTIAGDAEELNGFVDLFYGDGALPRNIPIGSIKSCMGHAEGASGLGSVIKCLMMMEKQILLPNLHFQSTSHEPLLSGYFDVVTDVKPWEPGLVCVSNYGFGGTNAFAILEPGNVKFDSSQEHYVTNGSSLCFGNNPTTPSTMNNGTQRWFQEQVRLGNERGFRFRNNLELSDPETALDTTAFIFGGQGSQWLNMGKFLYNESIIFQETIQRLDSHVSELLDDFKDIINIPVHCNQGICQSFSLIRLYQEGNQWLLRDFAALGVISYQVAMINILREIVFKPDFILGHSMGEVSAAYAAGIQSERETIGVSLTRSLISSKITSSKKVLKSLTIRPNLTESELPSPSLKGKVMFHYYCVPVEEDVIIDPDRGECVFDLKGSMAVVGQDAKTINSHIAQLNLQQTCIACFNSAKGHTVSGPTIEVDKLHDSMLTVSPELFWRNVNTDGVSFHSPMWESFEGLINLLLQKVFEGGIMRQWTSSWLSTSEIDPIHFNNITNFDIVEYHIKNITCPVFFQTALESLPKKCLVIEVGSSQSLLSQVKRGVRKGGIGTLGFVKVNSPSTEEFFARKSLAEDFRKALWEVGFDDKMKKSTREKEKIVNTLERIAVEDRYPHLWDHTTSHRVFTWEDYAKMEVDSKGSFASPTDMALIGEVLHTSPDYLLCRSFLSTSSHHWMKDHRVKGSVIFPGVGYLEMIFQAVCLFWPSDSDIVRQVTEAHIKMLFLSDDDTLVYTELVRNQGDRSVFDASIYTFQDQNKTLHFTCKINSTPDGSTQDEIMRSSFWLANQEMPSETSRLDKLGIYDDLLAGMNFTYGEAFKLLEYVESSDVRSRGEIDIKSVMVGEVGKYCAHPCMLDDALHALFPLLKTFSKSFVPVEFNDVVFYQSSNDSASQVQVDAEIIEIGGSFDYYILKVQIKGIISLSVTVKPLEQNPSDYTLFERVLVPAQIPLPTEPWTGWKEMITKEETVNADRILTEIMQTHVRNALATDEAERLIARDNAISLHVRRMIALAKDGCPQMELVSNQNEIVAKTSAFDLEMVNRVGQNLVRIWQNPKVAQEVLFHDDLMTNVYKGGCIFQEREAMRAKLSLYSAIKGLRVLEIGGGTGALTEIALDVLDDSTDYVFSDISPSFFAQARDRWGDRISCKIVDIGGVKTSEFDEVPYDLIIGFDVVHATSNIERTVQNLHNLLTPGGSMVVMDFVGCPWWAEMCFGVFEGWFLFEDNHRTNNCYLDQSSWQHLSETVGFSRFTIEHHGCHCVLGFGKVIEQKVDFDITLDKDLQLIDYVKCSDFEEKKVHTIRISSESREENALLVGFIRSLREEYPNHKFETFMANVDCVDVEVSPSGDLVRERYIKFQPRNHSLEQHPNGASFKQSFETRMLLPPSPELGENEVKVRILCSSLNFKDVAINLGLIDMPRDNLGFELYGEIISTSENSKFETGDHVVGYAMHNFATSTCVVEDTALVKVSQDDLDNISPQQMVANLVYITAFYTKKVANITKNDTVLIHSATGGFGLSCVHLCKRIGCTVVATAGTQKKRRYLKRELQIEHVFDSRGDWFAELCSSSLGEASINVVINSLAGNHNIKNGILSLAPMGRFCEVGKKDILHDPWFDRSVFKCRPCVSLHYIDMGYVMSGDCFDKAEEKGRFIEGLLLENDWTNCAPLPIQDIFPISSLNLAAQAMAKGTHIGRFLLDHTDKEGNPQKPITSVAPQYPRHGTYIISGGLGGLGIALAEYLCVETDAASVTLLTRRNKATITQDLRLSAIHDRISIVQCDVTRAEDVSSLRSMHEDEAVPYAIFHLAVRLVDKASSELTASDLANVYGPKMRGLENLYGTFSSSKHVVFSSVAGILGNFHQAAYSAAAQWVEEFARSKTNVHILNINSVTDVGEIAETPGLYTTMKRKGIMADVESRDVFESVNWLLATCNKQLIMLAPNNYDKLCGEGRIAERYESTNEKSNSNLLTSASLPDAVASIVMEELNLKKFDPTLKLTSYGLDSLSSVVIVKKLEKLGIEVSSMDLMQGISADDLVELAEE